MTSVPRNRDKRRALGRGLGALLPGADTGTSATQEAAKSSRAPSSPTQSKRSYYLAQIEDVTPCADQPRKLFDDPKLDELAASIRSYGVIQPLIVRARSKGGYELIAGERRWRAAQRAGLTEVPIVIQDVDDNEAFERALVENLQRSDLNPVEEALAFQRLVDDHGLTQDQVAQRVGKERSTVANSLRLLKLPPSVRAMVENSVLGMGHARALLGLGQVDEMEICARQIASQGLSVRAAEALVRKRQNPGKPSGSAAKKTKSASVRDIENRLTRALGTPVLLEADKNGTSGSLAVRYADLDDLDRLLETLLRP